MARRKKPPIPTTKPPAGDPAPAVAYRFGAVVLLRANDRETAVLTVTEARDLAAVLVREADLAATTPKTGPCTANRTYQLPGGPDGPAFYSNPKHRG